MAGNLILGTFHSLAFYNVSEQSLSKGTGLLIGYRSRRLSC
jgi:hypothetical protein